jgi:glycosyltransferase involved in cell wall biosynthesis
MRKDAPARTLSRGASPRPLFRGAADRASGPASVPTAAVLLPVRDAAATLDRALRSLWRQSRPDFRVVAVDDGSTDGSRAILDAHARSEPRLEIHHTPRRGLVAALETARAAARAPYLARFDADDVCHPDRFRRQVAYLDAHPRTAAVGSRVAMFPRRSLGPGWRRYLVWLNGLITPEDHAREAFVESPLAHPSVLMRAEALDAVGGYRETPWAEDYDLWLRFLEAGWDLAKVEAVLLAWRQTAGRLSLTSPRYDPRAFLAARAHFLARHPALAGGETMIWGAGRTGRRLARLLTAGGVRVTRFYEVDRRKIGGTVLGSPVRSWTELEPAGGPPLVVAVGTPGARALIRPETRSRGYREGVDLLFAA